MDGLLIVGRTGKPIVLSRFRHSRTVYPLLHADYLREVLAIIRANPQAQPLGEMAGVVASERDLPPILPVPMADAGEESDTESASDDISDVSDGSDAPSLPAEAQAWSEAARAPCDDEPAAVELEGGSVLCHIKVGELRFLCPVSREVNPLLPLTFLRRVVRVLQEYLVGSTSPELLTEEVLCEHFDVVYQLIEEMLDGDGHVLLTEVNALKDIVLLPSWLDKLVQTVGLDAAADRGRTSLTSPVPWRRPNSKYAKNEVYVDLIESLQGMVDATGAPIALDLWGRMECTAYLSGMPELLITLQSPELVENAAWHPCVRRPLWNEQKKVSCVPPDGMCELGTYHLRAASAAGSSALGQSALSQALPLNVHTSLEPWSAAQGGLAFSVALEPTLTSNHTLEEVCIEWKLGNHVHGVDATTQLQSRTSKAAMSSDIGSVPNVAGASGSIVFDRKQQLLRWTIPRLVPTHKTVLKGTILASEACRPLYAVQVHFLIIGLSLSGMRVGSIQMQQETYTPIKRARSVLQGQLEWRHCSSAMPGLH